MRRRSCECGELRTKLAAVMAEKAEVEARLLVLMRLDERRREAERDFGRQMVEARGVLSERKVDL